MHAWLVRKWDNVYKMPGNFCLRFSVVLIFFTFHPPLVISFCYGLRAPDEKILSLDPIGNQGKYLQ